MKVGQDVPTEKLKSSKKGTKIRDPHIYTFRDPIEAVN